MITKGLYRFIDSLTAKKNKIYIIPTKLGFVFTGIMFTLFLIGLSYGNNLTLSVAFILFTYFVLQMLSTHKNLNLLNFDQVSISNNFANQLLAITAQNSNDIINDSYELEIRKKIKSKLIVENDNQLKGHINYHRGHYKGNRIKLSNTGSSGLFYAWKFSEIHYEFYIYPTPQALDNKKDYEILHDEQSSEEEEFAFHRPYSTGLSSKRIDWKVYAKSDQLYWKKFVGEVRGELKIDYLKMLGDLETRLSHLTFLLQNAYLHNLKWTLTLPNEEFKNCSGYQDFNNCLKALARFKNA